MKVADKPLLLMDISRLFWRCRRKVPGGIDRVELAFAEFLLGSGHDVRYVFTDGGRLLCLAPSAARRLIQNASARWHGSSDDVSSRRVQDYLAGGDPFRPLSGRWPAYSLFFEELGEWGSSLTRYSMALRAQPSEADLRRATYVNLSHRNLGSKRLHHALQVTRRRIAYIHDDIPIRHPNLALKTLNRSFHEMFSQVLTTRFEIITNSLTSKRRIEETGLLFAYKFSNINVVVPPISEAFLSIKNNIPSARPFFVTTGLFTKRKNFQIIVEAVKRLSARPYPTPFDVVFVGTAGKDVADGFGDHQRNLGGIRLLHADALSDHGYRRLVRAARAVLAPSLDEGFDYPAHEARALGTTVLASDIEVHREGLSGAVTFIGSDDVDGWADAMAGCLSQSQPSGMAPEQIDVPKPLGSWQASCEAILRIALGH